MNFHSKAKYFLCLIVCLASLNGYCQHSDKIVLHYQIDFGLSRIYNYPKSIYFQSGNNANASLEMQLKIDSSNYFGLQAGIGQVRYFSDASIVERKLTANNSANKQQDFGFDFYRLSLSYERKVFQKLFLRASFGVIYYGTQGIAYKPNNSNEIVKEQSNLNFLKPISELGLVFGANPNPKVGFVTRFNIFSQNFLNASPVDFNLFIRFPIINLQR